tara:strand:+ start:377 stop:979 length:603 start_codon:yes stop_codon:yes gene_type:complete
LEKIYRIFTIIIFFLFLSNFNSEKIEIKDISNYINKIKSFDSNFIQINSNGDSLSGNIKLSKPNLLRIEYSPPVNRLIVSNGKKLAIINKRDKTISFYNVNQLPIKILLKDKFNINNYDIKRFEKKEGIITLELTIVDESNISSIELIFESSPLNLKKWIIRDFQGYQTKMFLKNTRINDKIDHKNYVIEDPRQIPFGNE